MLSKVARIIYDKSLLIAVAETSKLLRKTRGNSRSINGNHDTNTASVMRLADYRNYQRNEGMQKAFGSVAPGIFSNTNVFWNPIKVEIPR